MGKKISKTTKRTRGRERAGIRKTAKHRGHKTSTECQILWNQRLLILSRISHIQEITKVASWNCIGLGESIKVEALKNILNSEKPDILLVQETKMLEDEVMNRSSLF